VDETYIRIKGKWVYLYRAVDSTGATIDFLLSARRDSVAARRFLVKALGGANHPHPRVINTDKDAVYPPAIVQLKAEGALANGEMSASPGAISQQCTGTESSSHQTPGACKPTLSFILGSLGYDRRL
jgi:transposase-like protein